MTDEPFDPREHLALLCSRQQQFEVSPGGLPGLTGAEIAMALGMSGDLRPESLPNIAALYGRVKYAGEHESAPTLADLLMRYVILNADASWPHLPRPRWITDMCLLALAEAVDPHTCKWCKGRTWVELNNKRTTCQGCGGSGKRLPKPGDRARGMNLSQEEWRPWEKRYRDIQSLIERADGILRAALGRRMRETA